MARTHTGFGILLVSATAPALAAVYSPALFAGAALGAVLPDIDQPKAWLAQRVPGGAAIGTAIAHRTATHSLLFAYLAYQLGGDWGLGMGRWVQGFLAAHEAAGIWVVLGHLWGGGFALGLGLGVASHLLADMFNPPGAMLLWPLSIRRFRFLPESLCPLTGSVWEKRWYWMVYIVGLVVYPAAAVVSLLVMQGGLILGRWMRRKAKRGGIANAA